MNRRWLSLAAGLGTLLAFVVAGQVLKSPERPAPLVPEVEVERPEPSPIVEDLQVDLPRTARTGAEVFGINEGLAVPQHGMVRGVNAVDRNTLRTRAELVRGLGARWVRLNSHGFGGLNQLQVDLDNTDAVLQEAARAGLSVVVVIGPWPGTRTGSYTPSYLPEDLHGYANWVEHCVARYQGEGWPEIVWEVDNEPDLHNSEPPRGARGKAKPGSFETPAEYATVLLVTAEAIRRADPDATVLSGGMYRANTPKGKAYLERVLEQPGVLDAIDGLSLHLYFAESGLDPLYRLMDVAKELAPDKPVWITETSVPSSAQRAEIATPEWQAERVVALHGALLAEGVDRVFWHTLMDAPTPLHGGPSGMRSNSLYELVGEGVARIEPKPAAHTYRRLGERLADQPLAEAEALGQVALRFPDGVLVYDGRLPTPEGVTRYQDLLTGEEHDAAEAIDAPAWAW